MSRLLQWRRAAQEDRGLLHEFTCTTPARRIKVPPYGFEHERPWELVVQKYIRALEPPVGLPRKAWVGYDGPDLAAVAMLEEYDSPADVFLMVMAVAMPYRFQGGGYADEMMEFVLDEVTNAGVQLGYTSVAVSARIHRANAASRRLARRWKFRHTDWADDDLQIWAANIALPDAGVDFIEPGGLDQPF